VKSVPDNQQNPAHKTFSSDGAVKLSGVFNQQLLNLLASAVDKAMSSKDRYTRIQSSADDPGLFFSDYWASDRVPEIQQFLRQSPAAELAASVLNSSTARFFFDAIWVKEPGTQKVSTWHQDQPYYCVDGKQICIMWIPIDPVSRDTSLQCVQASHRSGKAYAPIRFTNGEGFGRGDQNAGMEGYDVMPDIESDAQFERLSWDFEPGDCLVFHGMTIHGAPGNSSLLRRRVISITWLGDDVRFIKRPGEMEPHRQHFDHWSNGCLLPEQDFPTLWPNSSKPFEVPNP
jgi:ectoine hydroxylase-related dioxygenase (phytanoyl-CoA dioxygenase family)